MHNIHIRRFLLTLACAGCLADNAAYRCGSDRACDSGHCIASACATVDGKCASGFRWDDSAGPLAGECASLPDLATDDQFIDPNCGNGKIDPGEYCDPGPGSPQPCPKSSAECDVGDRCLPGAIDGENCQAHCTHDTISDGKPCPAVDGGAPGVCYGFHCCTGCFDSQNNDCAAGSAGALCGSGGASCGNCVAGGVDGGVAECTVSTCTMAGDCQHAPAAAGTPCPSGQCNGFACCTGCVDGNGNCVGGDQTAECGSGGLACTDCTQRGGCVVGMGGHRCANCAGTCGMKTCGSDGCGGICGTCATNQVCTNGACVCGNSVENTDLLCGDGIDDDCNGKTDCADSGCIGKACSPNGGMFCLALKCVAGCRIGGTVYNAGDKNPMNACQGCDPVKSDMAWTNLDGQPCAKGTCEAGACCTGCWDGAACHAPGVATCGIGGAACADCNDKNPCHVPSCTAQGTCAQANVADGTKCGAADSCVEAKCACLGLQCLTGPSCVAGVCSDAAPVQYGGCCLVATHCAVDNNGAAACVL